MIVIWDPPIAKACLARHIPGTHQQAIIESPSVRTPPALAIICRPERRARAAHARHLRRENVVIDLRIVHNRPGAVAAYDNIV